jgi:anti-anti-sigma regulatory factor
MDNSGPSTITVDLARLPADAAIVEALGLLQLAARRDGRRLRLLNPSRELLELVELMGLADALRIEPGR